jgi:hypothetical protein
MMDRKRWTTAGLAGLVAGFAASAPLSAQETTPPDRPATRPGEIGQRPATPTPGQAGDRVARDMPAEDEHTGHAMLIAHALGMAIEGSALQGSAQSHGSAGADQANTNRADTNNAGQASRYTQQLQRHAMSAFEGSEKLFRQCEQTRSAGGAREGAQAENDPARTGSPVGQFYSAATEYADTLRRISGAGGQAADQLSEQDKAAVCLINHGLCEVVGAWKIRSAAGRDGSTNPALAALAEHAQEMDREGRQAILQFATPLGNPNEARLEAVEETKQRVEAASKQSPLVESLARNAQQILAAVDQMNQGGQPARPAGARPGVDPTAPEPGSGLRPGSNPEPGR